MTASLPLLERVQSDSFICKSRSHVPSWSLESRSPFSLPCRRMGSTFSGPSLAFALPSLESERTQSLHVFVGEKAERRGRGLYPPADLPSLVEK